MATRGQLLRSYVNQFGELLVANRKLQVEAGINRVQEQVAKGLVTPPSDEPLRDNRLYKEAWRDARSENMGREAGRLLMDDVPSMIAQAMEGYRYDQEGETPSERMTYLVDEWWAKHKQNVGFDDLSFNPNYTQQWEAAKTRAYGALRDVVQTETTKQALNEARGVIQTRLEQTGYEGDPNVFLSNSSFYKGIRDELVGMNYPLIRSQIEGLLHDEVISSNMNTLNDPASTQDEWMQALEAIEALDEKGFGDNGMSLSEIVTGKKSPESEASTRALAQFLSRMEKQKTLSTKQNDSTLDENWRRLSAMSDEEFAKQGRAYIAYNVPESKVNSMMTRFDRVTKENPNFNEGRKAFGQWRFNKMFQWEDKASLFNAMMSDPTISKPEHKEFFTEVLQEWEKWKSGEEKKRDDKKLLTRQQKGIDSFTSADFISDMFSEKLAKAQKKYLLDESDMAYLKAKSERLIALKNQMTDAATFQDFTNLIDRKDLWKMKHSDFQKAIKDFPADLKSEIRTIRNDQFQQKATDDQKKESLNREIKAQNRFAFLADATPEGIERLLKMDLTALREGDALRTEEGIPLWNELIDLQRHYQQEKTNAEAVARKDRRDRKYSNLTQDDPISKALLMRVDLEGEAGVVWAEKNNMSKEDLDLLRFRQNEIAKEFDAENLDALEKDVSGKELFRILELNDDEILAVEVSRNKLLTNEEHGKIILNLQRQIRERNKTIEDNAEKQRRAYWVKEFTDPNNEALLLGVTNQNLEKLLGKESAELQEVMSAKREVERLMLLPENERAMEREMFQYLEDVNLTTYSIETIQQTFAADIPGNQDRARKVLDRRSELIAEERQDAKERQKAQEALAPDNLRMDLEKEFSDINVKAPSFKKAQLLQALETHRTKINNNQLNLGEDHYTPLLTQVTEYIDQINNDTTDYTTNWRSLVTRLFNQNIRYGLDEYNFIEGEGDEKIFTTRLRIQRQQSTDRREVHKHMMQKFQQPETEKWTLSDVENYLIPYLEELDKTVQTKITSLTGLSETTGPIETFVDFGNLSEDAQSKIQQSNLPSEYNDILLYLYEPQRNITAPSPTQNTGSR